MEEEDLLKTAHDHINNYIKFADQKASVLVSGQIALIVVVLNIMSNTWSDLLKLTQILVSGSIILASLSILLSIMTIYPREESDQTYGYIYWEEIQNFENQDAFCDSLRDLNDDEIIQEMSDDVYNIAKIAQSKYKWLKRSLYFLIGFLALGGLSITVHILC